MFTYTRKSVPKFLPPRAALLVGLFLFFLSVETLAQHLPIRTYTIADGLAHDQVDKIVQDSRGFMWFCTMDGLSRFDGYRFANYGVKDGLPSARVNDMLESRRDGVYWVATNGGGVSRFDPRTDARLVAAARDGAGTAATNGEGRIFNLYPVGDESQSNVVEMLYEDRGGNLWIGLHNGGLARRRGDGRFELFGPQGKVPGGFGQGLYLDRAGRLWIATGGGGVRLEEPEAEDPRVTPFTTPGSLSSDNLRCFAEDERGRVYIGTARGVDRLDPEGGRVKHFSTADGLIKSEVMAAFRDRSGALWFGTREGVSWLVPE
ncbi:MAG: hypothetical protein H0T60_12810, partial [Acidobacteria bacterium]|nr:hypothetical protein [Acidobacteriota bacterium]